MRLARAVRNLTCALAWAIASPLLAQHATTSYAPAGYAPEMAPVMVPATSTPQTGSVTSSAATATTGTATFSSGSASIGPLAPVLNRNIRVILKGTWSGSFVVGTSSAANACAAGTINPLTIAGATWGSFTANANETVDTPTLGATTSAAAPVYCATATITSGTLTYELRQ
jgi:hypothetical protein